MQPLPVCVLRSTDKLSCAGFWPLEAQTPSTCQELRIRYQREHPDKECFPFPLRQRHLELLSGLSVFAGVIALMAIVIVSSYGILCATCCPRDLL